MKKYNKKVRQPKPAHQKRTAPIVAKQNLLPYQSTQKKSTCVFIKKIKTRALYGHSI